MPFRPRPDGLPPAIYIEGGTTVRTLAAENGKAFALLASMDEAQRGQAIIDHPVSALALVLATTAGRSRRRASLGQR